MIIENGVSFILSSKDFSIVLQSANDVGFLPVMFLIAVVVSDP